jgi:hypothetical protein
MLYKAILPDVGVLAICILLLTESPIQEEILVFTLLIMCILIG